MENRQIERVSRDERVNTVASDQSTFVHSVGGNMQETTGHRVNFSPSRVISHELEEQKTSKSLYTKFRDYVCVPTFRPTSNPLQ